MATENNTNGRFFAAIVNSPYIDWLGEYDTAGRSGVDNQPGSSQHINRGTALPMVTITPSKTGTKIADADIQAELLAQLAAGKLPAPQQGAEGGVDTLYVVAFPPSVAVSDFSGQDVCGGGCAYHWTVTVPGVKSGVPYAVIPDCSGSGQSYCSLGTGVFDTYTGDAAHELVEAITDPECGLVSGNADTRPMAWFDPAQQNGEGELGDICLSDASAFVSYQGYMVQAIWSQRMSKCITNDPALTLCDGKTRPCRPCTAADCSGATPVCSTDMTSPAWGQCVAPGSGGGDAGGGTSSGGSSTSSGGNGNGATGSGDGSRAPSSGGCAITPTPAPESEAALVGLFGIVAALAGVVGRRRARPLGGDRP